jgi:hypothetical protein
MDKAVTNSDAGKTNLVIESYDASTKADQGMRWAEFDLIITVDCGLEFGSPRGRSEQFWTISSGSQDRLHCNEG